MKKCPAGTKGVKQIPARLKGYFDIMQSRYILG
jgi:hypothetical protein